MSEPKAPDAIRLALDWLPSIAVQSAKSGLTEMATRVRRHDAAARHRLTALERVADAARAYLDKRGGSDAALESALRQLNGCV